MKFQWTPEVVDRARTLFHEGATASQACAILKTPSRMSVIAKWNRIGLKHSQRDVKAHNKVETERLVRKRKAEVVQTFAPRPQPGPTVEVEPVERVPRLDGNKPLPESLCLPLVDLRDSMCKWPLGDPRHSTFCFCAAKRRIGRVYCDSHHELSQPVVRPR